MKSFINPKNVLVKKNQRQISLRVVTAIALMLCAFFSGGCASPLIVDRMPAGAAKGYVEFYAPEGTHGLIVPILEVKGDGVWWDGGIINAQRIRIACDPGDNVFFVCFGGYGGRCRMADSPNSFEANLFLLGRKLSVSAQVHAGMITPVHVFIDEVVAATGKGSTTLKYTCKVKAEPPIKPVDGERIIAKDGNSKPVMLGTKSVMIMSERSDSTQDNQKAIAVMLAVSTMEAQCARQGIRMLTRHAYEDRVRAILKAQGAPSITLRYMDDGTTKTITMEHVEPNNVAGPQPAVPAASSTGASTSMWDAARSGNCDQIRKCLRDGMAIEARDQKDMTPLMIVALYGNMEAVTLLVANGANLNATNKFGLTPLKAAMENRPASITANTYHKESLGALTDVTLKTTSNLQQYLALIRFLIDKGADVNAIDNFGQTPIISKLHHYRDNMVGERLETVKLLIDNGAKVNTSSKYGTTPLLAVLSQFKVYEDTPELVKYLVEKGADVNASDNNGETPLMRAVAMKWHGKTFMDPDKNLEIVKLLVAKGANVNAKDKHGRTALWHAEQLGVLQPIAAFLKEHGAKEN